MRSTNGTAEPSALRLTRHHFVGCPQQVGPGQWTTRPSERPLLKRALLATPVRLRTFVSAAQAPRRTTQHPHGSCASCGLPVYRTAFLIGLVFRRLYLSHLNSTVSVCTKRRDHRVQIFHVQCNVSLEHNKQCMGLFRVSLMKICSAANQILIETYWTVGFCISLRVQEAGKGFDVVFSPFFFMFAC